MDLLTNKNIIIGVGISVVLASIFYFSSDSTQDTISTSKEKKVQEKTSKDIEIMYLESDKKEDIKTKEVSTYDVATSSKNKVSQNSKQYQKVSQMNFTEDESIEKFIEQRNLVDLNSKADVSEGAIVPKFSVYATIDKKQATQNRDNSIPPPPPVFFTVTSNSGEQYSGVVDAEVLSQGEVFITKNAPDGTKEDIVSVTEQQEATKNEEVPLQDEVIIVAPPSIGQ